MAAKKTPKPKSPFEVITTADPSSDEWQNAYDQLSPQNQSEIFNFGTDPTSSQAQPFGFADFGEDSNLPGLAGTGYTLPYGFDTSGVGIDPTSQGLTQFSGGVNIPQFTAAGKLDPYDLSQEVTRTNLFQDQVSSLMDLGMAGLAGPGAIDPSVFAPEQKLPTAKDRIATPGLDLLERYAKGTGYRAFLAKKMLPTEMGGENMTDDEALASLWEQVNKADDKTIDPKLQAAQAELKKSLPANTYQSNQLTPPSQQYGAAGLGTTPSTDTAAKQSVGPYDTGLVTGFAAKLFQDSLADQSAIGSAWQDTEGIVDPKRPGAYYSDSPVETPSAATKSFTEAGLPTPVEKYTDPKYTQMLGQSLGYGDQQALAQTLAEQDARTKAVQSQFDTAKAGALQADLSDQALQSAWNDYQSTLAPPPTPSGPDILALRQSPTAAFGRSRGIPGANVDPSTGGTYQLGPQAAPPAGPRPLPTMQSPLSPPAMNPMQPLNINPSTGGSLQGPAPGPGVRGGVDQGAGPKPGMVVGARGGVDQGAGPKPMTPEEYLRAAMQVLPENAGPIRPNPAAPSDPEAQLRAAMQVLPENAGPITPYAPSVAAAASPAGAAAATPPPQFAPQNQTTGPGINLGGRITGTSLGKYMGRVNNPVPGQPGGGLAITDRQSLQDALRQMGAQAAAQTYTGPYAVSQGGGFYTPTNNAQAAATMARGPVLPKGAPTFNFSDPLSRPRNQGATRLTEKQTKESETARKAADRRFVQANTARFQNYIAPGGGTPNSQAVTEALYRAMGSKTTPYQDAALQRMLAQRAAGLRA